MTIEPCWTGCGFRVSGGLRGDLLLDPISDVPQEPVGELAGPWPRLRRNANGHGSNWAGSSSEEIRETGDPLDDCLYG
jgi:hypothetical protein